MRIHQQKGLIQRKKFISSNIKDANRKEPTDKKTSVYRSLLADQVNQTVLSHFVETRRHNNKWSFCGNSFCGNKET